MHEGGNVWLTKTVPTDSGWGIFWLREDPGVSQSARVYYAHVDFTGQLTHGPMHLLDVPRIAFRGRYYLAAWEGQQYGLLTANRETLYHRRLSKEGTLSARRPVGPRLFVSAVSDQESDGDLDAYPDGFLGVIEGDCAGHSCSYAFKLDHNGTQVGSNLNLVDFDATHQFYPRSAFDGSGFAILSVKDISISGGGVVTKYLPIPGFLGSRAKVVPSKQYLWDEFPDVAWNGDHFAAVWTENSARNHSAPWQIHFAAFRRTASSSTLIADRLIDVPPQKSNQRWTTQIHAVGSDWVAQYASRQTDGTLAAVYELLDGNANTKKRLTPFQLTWDALGSSVHSAPSHAGAIGIAHGDRSGGQSRILFYVLDPPTCAP